MGFERPPSVPCGPSETSRSTRESSGAGGCSGALRPAWSGAVREHCVTTGAAEHDPATHRRGPSRRGCSHTAGLLDESHTLELKGDLPPGKAANKELALAQVRGILSTLLSGGFDLEGGLRHLIGALGQPILEPRHRRSSGRADRR